jgi:hypothetical protein
LPGDRFSSPYAVSVTTIEFRRRWYVFRASQKFRRLSGQLRAIVPGLDSTCVASYRSRRVTFFTLAPDEDVLGRAASTGQHVCAVRWTIPRRRRIWSAVYRIAGWSSMSGPPDGAWTAGAWADGAWADGALVAEAPADSGRAPSGMNGHGWSPDRDASE